MAWRSLFRPSPSVATMFSIAAWGDRRPPRSRTHPPRLSRDNPSRREITSMNRSSADDGRRDGWRQHRITSISTSGVPADGPARPVNDRDPGEREAEVDSSGDTGSKRRNREVGGIVPVDCDRCRRLAVALDECADELEVGAAGSNGFKGRHRGHRAGIVRGETAADRDRGSTAGRTGSRGPPHRGRRSGDGDRCGEPG